MYGIFTYIYLHFTIKNQLNVGKYTIPMDGIRVTYLPKTAPFRNTVFFASFWEGEPQRPPKIICKHFLPRCTVMKGITPRIKLIPSRKLAYPTWGKGKSSSKWTFQGIC